MTEKSVTLTIKELSTDHGAEDVLRGLNLVEGFISADISMSNKQVVVHYDSEVTQPEEFVRVIDETGFTATAI